MKTSLRPVAFLSWVVALALTTGCRLNLESYDVRTVTVVGNGEATVAPDLAVASIGVLTRGADAGQAVDQNSRTAQRISDGLQELGVDAADIQTSNFSISSLETYDELGRPTGEVTYLVDNTVTVTVRDLAQLGTLLNAAVKSGANSIYGVTFTVDDDSASRTTARQAAVDDARAHAEQLAGSVGATLGKVLSVSEVPQGVPGFLAYDVGYAGIGGGGGPPVSPGSLQVNVQVTVTYELK